MKELEMEVGNGVHAHIHGNPVALFYTSRIKATEIQTTYYHLADTGTNFPHIQWKSPG